MPILNREFMNRMKELRPAASSEERKRAKEEARRRKEQEARDLETGEQAAALPGCYPVRAIPPDLYSTRVLPGADKGGERGRDRLRDTFKYWQVICPTSATTLVEGETPNEEHLKNWAKELMDYVTKNFRQTLKQFIKTQMVKYMVEERDGIPGIRFKQTKAAPNNFNSLKKYLREELVTLPIKERDEVIKRLFYIMYIMFRSKYNGWMIDECNAIMERRRLKCK
jgi:hypothetical protein